MASKLLDTKVNQLFIYKQLKIVEKTERIIHLEKKVDSLAKTDVVDKLGRDVHTVKEKQSTMNERLNQLERSGYAGGNTRNPQILQEAAAGIYHMRFILEGRLRISV